MNLQAQQPIGIFDSGIGGLTVANAVSRYLPNERIIYFGDTAHLPYGDKAPASIKTYTQRICEFLLDQECKMIVVACNTASSIAAGVVDQTTQGKAHSINVIDPVVEMVTADRSNQSIGVIGTKGTIKSEVYANKLKTINANLAVHSLATPLLVPVIEEMLTKSKISKAVIEQYLSNKELQNLDVLILGCTHYPLIKTEIEQFYEGRTRVVDAAEIVSLKVKELLEANGLLNLDPLSTKHHFYVSDYTESFEKSTHAFFGREVHLEEVNLWI